MRPPEVLLVAVVLLGFVLLLPLLLLLVTRVGMPMIELS
jgi:hypothetical protein